jgi:hypothetical protein
MGETWIIATDVGLVGHEMRDNGWREQWVATRAIGLLDNQSQILATVTFSFEYVFLFLNLLFCFFF